MEEEEMREGRQELLEQCKLELEDGLRIAKNIEDNIQNLKNQIEGLNNRGKEISYRCTYLQGRVDALGELIKKDG